MPFFGFNLSCFGLCAELVLFCIETPGTDAHRAGGSSFPKQLTTKPLLPFDEVAILQEETPEQVCSDQELAQKDVQQLIQGEFAKAQKAKLEAKKAAAQLQQDPSLLPQPRCLSLSPSLRHACQWVASVPVVGVQEACCMTFEAEKICKQWTGQTNVSGLSRLWHSRHLSIPAAQPQKGVRGLHESKCHQAGVCHCSRTRGGVLSGHFWRFALRSLQKMFPPRSTALEGLLQGQVVLCWSSWMPNNVEEFHVEALHVSCHYRKPWRPTMLRLKPVSPQDAAALHKVIQASSDGRQTEEVTFTTWQVASTDGLPDFTTAESFAALADKDRHWSVSSLQLSQRPTPFPGSAGQIRLVCPQALDCKNFWFGMATRLPKSRSTQPRSHAHDGGAERERTSSTTSSRAAIPSELQTANTDENEDEEEEDYEDDSDVEMHFDLDDATLNTLREAETVLGERPNNSKPSRASSTSSSGSSSSSSSDTRSGKDGRPRSPDTSADPTSTSAMQSSHEDHSRKRRKTTLPETESQSRLGVLRDASHTEEFGPHHLTPRFKDGKVAAYQMLCRTPGHDKCTKELALSVTGSEERTRLVLKSWALLGAHYSSREHHMMPSLKTELLQAAQEGKLVAEADLNTFVTMSSDQGIPAPLRPLSQVSTVGGAVRVPQNQVLDRSQTPNVLGARGTNVPLEVHQEMEALALAGKVPVTSLQQRERNKGTSKSTYGVPPAFTAALKHGYLSPNLPAPLGMRWRCHAGTWRLSPLGG